MYVNSSLGTRVSVDQIGRDCESEILEIMLMIDLQVVYIVGIGCRSRHGLGWRPIGLSVIMILGGLSLTHRTVLSGVGLHMHFI